MDSFSKAIAAEAYVGDPVARASEVAIVHLLSEVDCSHLMLVDSRIRMEGGNNCRDPDRYLESKVEKSDGRSRYANKPFMKI